MAGENNRIRAKEHFYIPLNVHATQTAYFEAGREYTVTRAQAEAAVATGKAEYVADEAARKPAKS